MTKRSANIVARVEPEIKAKSEAILNNIGLSMSDAVNLFCKQIIIQNGIPFSLKSDIPPELDATSWTEADIAREVLQGKQEIKQGKLSPFQDVFSEIEGELSYAV